jgi:hypothetical protein
LTETVTRAEAIAMIAQARQTLCEPQRIDELLEDYGAETLLDALLHEYAGVSNGFMSQICSAIAARKLDVIGVPEPLLPCPCCARRTLTERHDVALGTGYDICDFCGWEDDGTSDITVRSSVNRGSMAEYRDRIGREASPCPCDKWPSGPAIDSDA